MPHSTANIRNIALIGRAGAGKTLLLDALLAAGGALATSGSIERGTTVSDHDPMEIDRGHSLDAAVAGVDIDEVHLNLIDTPGHPDFRGPAIAALAAVETAAVVLPADGGIDHTARRLLAAAGDRRLARVIIVNRIDAEGADCAGVLAALHEQVGRHLLPVNLPTGDGAAVIDCLTPNPDNPSADSDLGPVADWHSRILDQVVEVDDTVMEHYLTDGEAALGNAELHAAFEQGLREDHLIPVCFTSARTGAGVQEFLDIARRWLPHPGEANPPEFTRGEDRTPVDARPDPDAHVIADVFRVVNDPFVGKLGVFRVFQGTVRKDSQLFVDDGRKPFKVAHLYAVQGKDHPEIDCAVPGDIAAVAKVDDLHVDAVLHDSHDEDQIHLAPLDFPAPMFAIAVTATSRGQEQKLALALHKLAEEDPALVVEHTELNEIVLRGLSDLHLRIMLERLAGRFGVEVTTAPPRIAYRETIAAPADGHYRHKKQTGGAGQFGEVFLRVEPLDRGAGFVFADEVKGGAIPGQFIPAVEKGVRQVLASGAIAGYPVQDVKVVVYDGKYHSVDSKEVAFVAAGRKAFLDAIAKATPQVLEPVVDLEVIAPESTMGDISGGLAAKRARISGTDASAGEIVIRAQVPLSELDDYAVELKSVTAGRGRYAVDFSHYEPVPPQVQKQLVADYRPHHEE